MKKCLFMMICVLGISSCHVHMRYPNRIPMENAIQQEMVYWFWGLKGNFSYEVYELCPAGKVYEIRSHHTMTQGALTILTAGIYAPRTLEVICAASKETQTEIPKLLKKQAPTKPESSSSNSESSSKQNPLETKRNWRFDQR